MHVVAGLEIPALSALRGFLSTRGGPVRLFLPPPYLPASTSPGEGLHGGLLEGSCGRRRRRGMPNLKNVGEPAYLFQNMKSSYPKPVRQITAASSTYCSFSTNQCFEKHNYVCLKTLSSTRVQRVRLFFDQRVRLPRLNRVPPTAYPMIRTSGVGA